MIKVGTRFYRVVRATSVIMIAMWIIGRYTFLTEPGIDFVLLAVALLIVSQYHLHTETENVGGEPNR